MCSTALLHLINVLMIISISVITLISSRSRGEMKKYDRHMCLDINKQMLGIVIAFDNDFSLARCNYSRK